MENSGRMHWAHSRGSVRCSSGRRFCETTTGAKPGCLTIVFWGQSGCGLIGCARFPGTGGERSRLASVSPGGVFQATKLDDHTLEPQAAYRFRAGPQAVKLSVEWPLPGAADWTGVPSKETPWLVSADQLFQTSAGSGLNCDDWLGQQVVLFDGKGVSLKEMIRTVVNFEGAHSIDVGRLAVVEGEVASRAATNPAPHILNSVTVFGIRFAHLIVIECALYLYEKLLDESSIERPSGDIYKVTPGVECSPEQAESPRPDWIRFQGSMMISFSDLPKVVYHKIKGVN